MAFAQSTTLTVDDLITKEVIAYDPDYAKQCHKVCIDRNIDYLPDMLDSHSVHRRIPQGAFEKIPLEREQKIDCSLAAFDASLLPAFRAHRVLFAYSAGVLQGVIHFSDYNNTATRSYLYARMALYETGLRQLLIQHGFSDPDLIAWLTAERRTGDAKYYEKRLTAMNDGATKAPPLQAAYLWQLIDFARAKDVISLSVDVNDLRNQVMHQHDPVNQRTGHAEPYVYSFTTFEAYFGRVVTTFQDLRRIQNRLLLLQSK